jgi:hypothetical protein
MITNEIREIHSGVFCTLLDFPSQDELISQLVVENLPFVMLCDVRLGNYTWQQFEINGGETIRGFARSLAGDFVIPTSEFAASHSKISWQRAIQLKSMPPDYFDSSSIKGRERYRILSECGFRFEVQSQPGGGDYCQLISPSKELLQAMIENENIYDED